VTKDMEESNKGHKRIIWWLELINLTLLLIQLAGAIKIHNSGVVLLVIMAFMVYLYLSIHFYFALNKKIFLSELKHPVNDVKEDLTENERNKFISFCIFELSLVKFFVVLIILNLAMNIVYNFGKVLPYLSVVIFLVLLAVIFYLIVSFLKHLVNSKGYINTSRKEILTKYLFYYNSENKRVVVSKPLGRGSTINLATKDGKLILGIILFPVIIVFLVIFILILTHKI
jgi:uncharacterized membrane protein